MKMCLIYLIVFLCTLVAPAPAIEDTLDPKGSITIIWDVVSMSQKKYDVYVSIKNEQLYRSIRWQLSWTWAADEVIWFTLGAAKVRNQGEKSPTIIDLFPWAPNRFRTNNCCKASYLSSLQDPQNNIAQFRLVVGNKNNIVNKSYIAAPSNFNLGVPGYKCGSPIFQGRRRHSAKQRPEYDHDPSRSLFSWHVLCQFSQPTPSQCCVSLSTYYNPNTLECPSCSCGCNDREKCLKDENNRNNPPTKCTSHMCPISVHWQVLDSSWDFWWVRITLTNYNLNMNYSNWNMIIRHPGFSSIVNSYNFNYTALPSQQNDTVLFRGIIGKADNLPYGRMVDILKLRKEKGKFTWEGEWVFPDLVYFNGEHCTIPEPRQIPKLPPYSIYINYRTRGFVHVSMTILVLVVIVSQIYVRRKVLREIHRDKQHYE